MSDFGIPTAPDTIRIERVLPGPIERVWAYLTESDKRATWLAGGEMELRVGGRVEHIFRNADLTTPDDPPPAKYGTANDVQHMHGTITVCDPPRALGYTWSEEIGGDSEVRFDLSPRGDEVLLVVTHTRLRTRDLLIGVAAGWHTHLGMLADRLSGRASPKFWATHMRLEEEYERIVPA